MTSFEHDDTIEIISVHVETPVGQSDYELLENHVVKTSAQSKPEVRPPQKQPVVLTKQQRRIKLAVTVMGTLFVISSFLVVVIALSMYEHINDLVREHYASTQRPNRGRTPRPTTPIPKPNTDSSHYRTQTNKQNEVGRKRKRQIRIANTTHRSGNIIPSGGSKLPIDFL